MINITPIIILHTMIVIDLGMTNIITNLLPNHIILPHVPIITLPLLVVHSNITLVLANAPLAITTPLLNDITLPTVLLLNHVMIAIVVDRHHFQNYTLIFNINPLLTLLNRLLHSFIIILLRNPTLMYQPNTSSQYPSLSNEHANAITPSTWFVNLYIFKPIEDTPLPSKLELIFLPDSGASICVLNLPTSTI